MEAGCLLGEHSPAPIVRHEEQRPKAVALLESTRKTSLGRQCDRPGNIVGHLRRSCRILNSMDRTRSVLWVLLASLAPVVGAFLLTAGLSSSREPRGSLPAASVRGAKISSIAPVGQPMLVVSMGGCDCGRLSLRRIVEETPRDVKHLFVFDSAPTSREVELLRLKGRYVVDHDHRISEELLVTFPPQAFLLDKNGIVLDQSDSNRDLISFMSSVHRVTP